MREELKDYLKNNGIKQKFIAEQLNVSTSLISRYLQGTRTLSAEKEFLLKQIIK